MLKVAKPRTDSSGVASRNPRCGCGRCLRYPDIADLMSRLHFSRAKGASGLDDQRMVLVHHLGDGRAARD